MYCKECGQRFQNDSASVCLNCGVNKGKGSNYCGECGEARKSENQDVCLNCGNKLKQLVPISTGKKTKLVLLLLWFFLGGFGVHHFYVGNNKKGILYIALTLGGVITCGLTTIGTAILLIIDIVNILTDKFVDANGNAITEWN